MVGAIAVPPWGFRWGDTSRYENKILTVSPGNLIAYWPLWEGSGTVADNYEGTAARDGAYTGVTLGQAGIGDGRTCPLFDGANDYVDIYSASLNSALDLATLADFSVMIWAKVLNSGVWSDGTVDNPFDIGADSVNNFLRIDKAAAANRLQFFYKAGGTLKTVTKNGVTSTDWINFILTVDETNDEFKAYYNGVQEGSTQTALGDFAGALAENNTNIGSQTEGPALPWNGYLAHCAIWNTVLNANQILSLATV